VRTSSEAIDPDIISDDGAAGTTVVLLPGTTVEPDTDPSVVVVPIVLLVDSVDEPLIELSIAPPVELDPDKLESEVPEGAVEFISLEAPTDELTSEPELVVAFTSVLTEEPVSDEAPTEDDPD